MLVTASRWIALGLACALACDGWLTPQQETPGGTVPAKKIVADAFPYPDASLAIIRWDGTRSDAPASLAPLLDGDGEGGGGGGGPFPVDCGDGVARFLDYTAERTLASGEPPEVMLESVKEMIREHLLVVANVACASCPIPGACTAEVGTIDSNWTTYVYCHQTGGFLVAVAKYTGAFTVYCTPCVLDPD